MVVDFLVVGGGVAGLRAAAGLAESGRVLVVTKEGLSESNTAYAQGGIAVAMGGDEDVALHLADTIVAGDALVHAQAAAVLVEQGPKRVEELLAWGTRFDRYAADDPARADQEDQFLADGLWNSDRQGVDDPEQRECPRVLAETPLCVLPRRHGSRVRPVPHRPHLAAKRVRGNTVPGSRVIRVHGEPDERCARPAALDALNHRLLGAFVSKVATARVM